MKLNSSLKKYILFSLLLTSTVLIIILSSIAVKYFFSGLDLASANFLHSQAIFTKLDEQKTPVQVGDVTIAAFWKDLPEPIKNSFNEVDLIPNKLTKKVAGYPILSPPDYVYFVIKAVADDKTRYAAMVLIDPSKNSDGSRKSPLFLYILYISLSALSAFSLVLFLLFRRATIPVRKLKNWAKSIDEKQLSKPTPDFQYSELNTLAELIQSSLKSVQESVEREKRFLGYASHELRTPIAVTRTNAELLRKMIDRSFDKEKQIEVLDRIERAGLNMTDLTETLLWLNREEDKVLPQNNIVFGDLIQQIVQDLNYLLNGKTVNLTVSCDTQILLVPDVLCRVVMTNLIRNAFQHTTEGNVLIKQVGYTLSITNQSNSSDLVPLTPDNLGFGLGLELTEKLITKYGWHYKNINIENGRFAEVKVTELTQESNT